MLSGGQNYTAPSRQNTGCQSTETNALGCPFGGQYFSITVSTLPAAEAHRKPDTFGHGRS